MHWVVLGGAFVIFWFLALQIVMPMGARSAHEAGETVVEGSEPGAPVRSHLGVKFAAATLAAIAMWIILYLLVLLKVVDL